MEYLLNTEVLKPFRYFETEYPLRRQPLLTLDTVCHIPHPIKQSLARPLRDGA